VALGTSWSKMVDGRIRSKLVKGLRRIAETHQDRRHVGPLSGADIHVAASHHDGVGRLTAGKRDHMGDVAWSGFDTANVLWPATL
jgi:hypothetical protein